MTKHFGLRFRLLHWCSDQMLTNDLARMDLTSSQGRMICFLAHCPRPPCPRDIEEYFGLSHPSVSGTLSRMEKKGFIEFIPDETDRRIKRIYLLPRGRECHSQIMQTISQIEQKLMTGFSPEEQAQFSSFLDRVIHNMGADCCHHKEDHT